MSGYLCRHFGLSGLSVSALETWFVYSLRKLAGMNLKWIFFTDHSVIRVAQCLAAKLAHRDCIYNSWTRRSGMCRRCKEGGKRRMDGHGL